MPFAVEMFLDETTADVVRQTWQAVADADVAQYLNTSNARPHVTLAVAQNVDVPACDRLLAELAATTPIRSVTFSSLGVFPSESAVVFLAPVVTADLLAFHAAFHRRFADLAGEPWAYYLPGCWVPHCTLAQDFAVANVPRAVEACRQIRLPLSGCFVEIALVEFRPVRHVVSHRFALT